jgi:hypothetical protein
MVSSGKGPVGHNMDSPDNKNGTLKLESLPDELKGTIPVVKTKNGNHLVIVDNENLAIFQIKDEKSFQFGDRKEKPVAILVASEKHDALGIALGRINNDKTSITIGGIQYNDSTEDRYSSSAEVLPYHRHIVVSIPNADKKFSQSDIDKIDQLVTDMAKEHKARRSSLENNAPKFAVADVKEAGQAGAIPGRPAKSIRI